MAKLPVADSDWRSDWRSDWDRRHPGANWHWRNPVANGNRGEPPSGDAYCVRFRGWTSIWPAV